MFEILIIEDSQEKLRNILQVLDRIVGINIDDIISIGDVVGAKRILVEKKFDLLILDIALPNRRSDEINPNAGIQLLDEITSRDIYNVPIHIIGLTAFDDILQNSKDKFDEKILTIIKYEQNSIVWQTQLIEGVKQRILSKRVVNYTAPDYCYDAAIICALPIELKANRENGWDWGILPNDDDDSIYYAANLLRENKTPIKIVCAHSFQMGMPSTTALAMKMIMQYRPRYIIITGIMAGIKGKVNKGDIIISNPVWDWGSGKWTIVKETDDINNTSKFEIEPFQFSVDTYLLKQISLLKETEDFLFNIRKGFKSDFPKHDIDIHVGPVASGASVLANIQMIQGIREQNRKLIGIDMEAFGIYCAAECAPRPKPFPIAIKSVVDFGDSAKNDEYHEFGCYVSAVIAKKLIENLYSL